MSVPFVACQFACRLVGTTLIVSCGVVVCHAKLPRVLSVRRRGRLHFGEVEFL